MNGSILPILRQFACSIRAFRGHRLLGESRGLPVPQATSTNPGTLTYSATGLPAGLSINASTGKITGTATTLGTSNVTVTAKDSTNATGTTTFTWKIYAPGPCDPKQLLGNPGFESGKTVWTATTGVIDNSWSQPAHTGIWRAWLNGRDHASTDTLSQTVTLPAGCSAPLTYWQYINTDEAMAGIQYDKLTVQANTATVATASNLDAAEGYVKKTVNLSAFAGKSVTLKSTGTEDEWYTTSFVIDDVALTINP
ncbi:Ig domain-containing protein [Streptomyces sp. NBC_00090]|uniref:Ig domain-containing protein n=1 Tax=Streptomyces sp. NBC_00090 TaxID=2903619 RepID=UPI00324EB0AD